MFHLDKGDISAETDGHLGEALVFSKSIKSTINLNVQELFVTVDDLLAAGWMDD